MHQYKVIVTFLFIGFLFSKNSLAQTKEDKIKLIRQTVQTINKFKNLKKILLRNDEFLEDGVPDGGGELTGYFKNGELVKIFESIGISNGMNDIEYYLKDNKLIFAYEVKKHFEVNQKTFSFNYEKLNTVFEGRYYFDQNKLIDTKIKGENEHADDEKDYTNQLIKQVNRCMILLKAKTK